MLKLIATVGLPGSGKSTWARRQPAWRVNRDDLRAMMRRQWVHGDRDDEDALTEIQHDAIRVLLRRGRDVVVDDTNLRPEVLDALRDIAEQHGAQFVIEDFWHVPLRVCLERDAARPQPVGEKVIRGMWERYGPRDRGAAGRRRRQPTH